MNCDSWLLPKNSLIAATTGRMLIRTCGVICPVSWMVIRSRVAHALFGHDVQHFPARRSDPQDDAGAGLEFFDVDGLAIHAHGDARQLPGILAPILQDERKFLLVSPDGDVLDLPPCRLDQGT